MQLSTALMGLSQTALALAIAARLLLRAKQSHAWPAVEGTVIESTVRARNQNDSAHVKYAYTIDGRSYESRRVAMGMRFASSGNLASRVVARFAAGTRVAVAVDPANPAYSVLERGIKPGLVFLVVACVFFAIGGMALLVLSTGLIPAAAP